MSAWATAAFGIRLAGFWTIQGRILDISIEGEVHKVQVTRTPNPLMLNSRKSIIYPISMYLFHTRLKVFMTRILYFQNI
jgi:hypothetical protein